LTKPEPLTVKVNAGPPAVTELGERLVIAGTGEGAIVNVKALEIAPLGLATVTLATPGEAIRLAGTKALSCPELI